MCDQIRSIFEPGCTAEPARNLISIFGGNAIRESVLEVINQMIDLGNQMLYVMVIA